jgi:hypothetical protein
MTDEGVPMSRQLKHGAIILAAAIMALLATGAAARATGRDTAPPTAPFVNYASGLKWLGGCLPLTVGIMRSTDNATPQSALIYQVFADGVLVGSLTDRGASNGVWGVLTLRHAGRNAITARAVDAAGNRSALSNTQIITGYGC